MPRPNHRDPETDLAAALGEELRRLRAQAGYATQDPFAKALGYGREQVSKIETGYDLPSESLFDRWLDLCQATEQDRYYLDRSLRQARRARAATPAFAKPWLYAEGKAEYLLLWAPVLVPGLLQVREYATAVFVEAGFSEEEAGAKAFAQPVVGVRRRYSAVGRPARARPAVRGVLPLPRLRKRVRRLTP